MENLKKMAGIKAAEFVKDGMVVGLGTGSTAYYFVEEIGRRIKEGGLQITAVTMSLVLWSTDYSTKWWIRSLLLDVMEFRF